MRMIDTANAARARWTGILPALGIDSKYLVDKHGPCPMCGGKDRFRFDDKLNGSWICNQCGNGDGFDLLKRVLNWSTKQAKDAVDSVVGNIPETAEKAKPQRTDEDKAKVCRWLLEGAGPLKSGSPAFRYLEHRCGALPAALTDLRAHPSIKHSADGNKHPGLLGIMRYAEGGGASVHRTYLTEDGRKASVDPVRMMMPGLSLAGSCVRLGPVAERIGIAEGIETAICAGKLFGLPVWAATCANLLASWEPPAGVKSVLILGDNDANNTGQLAAWKLAIRLAELGLHVEVQIPQIVGTDFADVFMNQGEAA